MDSKKVLSALCYFSVLFAPFIVPIVIYFVSEESFVKRHAKSSLLSHIIPAVFLPIVFAAAYYDMAQAAGVPVLLLITFIGFGLVSFIILIWNLIRGVKLLIN
ncbi:MAG: DUF4870 domain-containing protein [Bacillus sp. (in: firmicutes)]